MAFPKLNWTSAYVGDFYILNMVTSRNKLNDISNSKLNKKKSSIYL